MRRKPAPRSMRGGHRFADKNMRNLDTDRWPIPPSPAVFVILFAGFVVVGAALVVETLYAPPLWVHAVLWLPLILLTTLVPLRSIKGVLIALQYHHKAAEGRLQRRGEQ